MHAPVATKPELRALALARRAGLAETERGEASRRAVDRLAPLIRPRDTVALFWPMRGEIDPLGLAPHVEKLGGRVVLPATNKRDMTFRLFDGEAGLEDGAFGTRHPNAGQPALDPDFIVAPLAAFDRHGGRIGYGAGYYDRATAALRARGKDFRLAGIAFACQEVDRVPVEPHDEPLEFIATEAELIRVGRSQAGPAA